MELRLNLAFGCRGKYKDLLFIIIPSCRSFPLDKINNDTKHPVVSTIIGWVE